MIKTWKLKTTKFICDHGRKSFIGVVVANILTEWTQEQLSI
jgi:hypothetical protein